MASRNEHPRRFRFSLRALLVFTLLFALVSGWFGLKLAQERRYQRIAAELQAAHCDVEFFPRANPSITGFLERLGFATEQRRIKVIRIWPRSGLATALKLVQEMGELDTIVFYRNDITASQLSDMFENVDVRSVYAESARLPRTGMEWLNHDGLRWLCLSRTQLSNPAIDNLPDTLEYFDATRTRINDDGLNSFVRLKNLKLLNLRRTPTSENAINALRQRMPWCEIEWESLHQP